MKARLCTLFVLAVLLPGQMARADSGQTLHVVIAADTSDEAIGPMVKANLKHLKEEVKQIAEYSGQKLKLRVVSGKNLTAVKVMKAVSDLSPGKDDAVLFLYSGHGSRTAEKSGSFPDLNFHDQTVGLEKIFLALRAKNPRLLLVFSDSCNNLPNQPIPEHLSGQLPAVEKASLSKAGYRKLFARQRGAVIASGTRPQEFGIYSASGGVFTNSLCAAIKVGSAASNPSWEVVMKQAAKPLQFATNVQRPIYKVYAATGPDGKAKKAG